ncbi:hypothetical protein M513_05658 [Trichuris suis]|uniref:Uncharacterized protein n=1 Tax=Trichuris suis TaxID=68888 RepID=A0A085M848_9BILA|nr:hypothetical protein M513_05658 [Trichuris suis]
MKETKKVQARPGMPEKLCKLALRAYASPECNSDCTKSAEQFAYVLVLQVGELKSDVLFDFVGQLTFSAREETQSPIYSFFLKYFTFRAARASCSVKILFAAAYMLAVYPSVEIMKFSTEAMQMMIKSFSSLNSSSQFLMHRCTQLMIYHLNGRKMKFD